MITPNETTINISLFEYYQLCKMRKKYQKIEQLIADYENGEWEHIAVYRIREIIDGNDN